MNINREILVFGATGGTGIAIVREAISRGYGVTAFVRNIEHAQHVFNDISDKLCFSEGDAQDPAAVRRAIGSSLTAVVSALGIYQRKSGNDDLTRATHKILEAMQATGPQRLVCVSSLGVGDSRNQGDFIARLIQKTGLRHTLADKALQEAAIIDSGLNWTIVRPSRLLNKGGTPDYHTWSGAQPATKLTWSVTRKQVAELVLDCLDDDQSVGKALNITGTRSG